MPVDVGQIVASKYELVRLLGRGSMGEVWTAHHKALGEQVALKLLAWPPSGEDAEEPAVALARFRFEAQVAARLSRKTRHIAQVTDYGEDDGLPYLVMELLHGEALDAALRARGPFGLAEAVEVVSQIARALVQAHAEGVAHRDLKPANVFLSRDEEGRLLVKLLDFGIARTIQPRQARRVGGPGGTFATARGFVFGTPGYMSPEQSRASSALDHRCDVWALATIAYEMLTQHLPVDGDNADDVMKNVSAGRIIPLRERDARLPAPLGPFFERAFAEHVDDRFAGAASLAQAFDLAAGGGISGSFEAPPLPGLPDSTGSTAIDFAANVAEATAEVRRWRPTLLSGSSLGALVLAASIVGVLGARAAWRTTPSAAADAIAPPAAAPPPPTRTTPSPQPILDPPSSPVVLAPAGAAEEVTALTRTRRATTDRAAPRAAAPQAQPNPQRAHALPRQPENRDDVF
jgi:serine/threonine protein kinase